jgi:hypothetical protein
MSATPVTTPSESPDPAVLRAEWRLRLLEEMAEITMDLARVVHRQAQAAAEPAEANSIEAAEVPATRARTASPTPPDPSEALARISRALRLTLALHARTDEQLRALQAGITAECEARRVETARRAASEAEARSAGRREAVERLVFEAAEREIDDDEAFGDVIEALEERLEGDEAYQDLDCAPLREIVKRLCADLELTPDWSRWEGEGWAAEPFFRPKLSLWARPSRRPLFRLEAPTRLAQVAAPGSRRLE